MDHLPPNQTETISWNNRTGGRSYWSRGYTPAIVGCLPSASAKASYAPARTDPSATVQPAFIRRFLLHVVPDGFQRIGYYGFLGNPQTEISTFQTANLPDFQIDDL
jgi:Putative transposase